MKLQHLQNLNVLSKTHFLYVSYSHGLILCQFCTYLPSFSFLVNHTESVTCILEACRGLKRQDKGICCCLSMPIHPGWSKMIDYMDNQCKNLHFLSIEILNVAIY